MNQNTEPILETKNLGRTVDGHPLVADISIQVQQGGRLAVVGPSGAGKSSFLRLLNRLDEPTAGTVLLEGIDYRQLPPQDLRRRVGMVMQAPHLFPGTVAANLDFGPRQRGEELGREAIEELLRRVNLAGYADRDVNKLSGGEAQRVSLARTLANGPEVLLLDEPTSALDEATRRDVEALIQSIIHDQALTCLIVTHDKDQARRLADKTLVLEEGRLVRFGPAKEVLDA
jgi:putative ABC transport system ATP-binding protein